MSRKQKLFYNLKYFHTESCLHTFFISNTFISNTLKLARNQAKAKQLPEFKLLLFENYLHSSSTLSSKNNGEYFLKNVQKTSVPVLLILLICYIWLIIMTMTMKMKNRSYRYDTNGPRTRHRHKYTKYKKCLSMMKCLYVLTKTWATFEAQFMKS